MNGIDIGDLGGTDDAIDFQIAFASRCRADADRLVGKLHMKGVYVRFGINSNGADSQLLAGAYDPQGNLPAIGDKNFLKHGVGDPVALADPEENLAKLNRLPVFGDNLHDLAGNLGLDFIHDLHRFDDADDTLGCD